MRSTFHHVNANAVILGHLSPFPQTFCETAARLAVAEAEASRKEELRETVARKNALAESRVGTKE